MITPTSPSVQGTKKLIMAATRNQQVLKHTIRLFSRSGKEGLAVGGGTGTGTAGISSDEFEESEVIWASFSPPQSAGPWPTWKNVSDEPVGLTTVGSLPVHIPDWSRIQSRAFEEEEEEEEETVLPPHELVWRRRVESFSVVEGMGRTLKGRDLSRVRNAVWAQTGFQD